MSTTNPSFDNSSPLELNDAGHQTAEACNGEEALSQAVSYEPDIIISDISMPVMNGYQFFPRPAGKSPELQPNPIIFLSALAEKDDMLKGYRLGADDYIPKPIDYDLLLARVDARLRQVSLPAAAREAGGQDLAYGSEDVDLASIQDAGDEKAAARVSELIEESDGKLVAAKLETIRLDEIRKRYGERCYEVRDKILRNAGQVIRQHLTKDDVFHAKPTGDFMVSFAHPDHDLASHKIQIIKDDIWERLFGETGDTAVADVRTAVHELTFDREEAATTDGLFGRLYEKIKAAGSVKRRSLENDLGRIFANEDIGFTEIRRRGLRTGRILTAAFSYKVSRQIDDLLDQKKLETGAVTKLHAVLLDRIVSKIEQKNGAPLIIPLRFTMTAGDHRNELNKLLQSIDQDLQNMIVIERVQLPNRLNAAGEVMKPLSVGRRIQALELRKPAQVDNFDLRKMRVGILTMKFDDVSHCYAGGMDSVIEDFKKYGGQFYIKEIPQEKLSDVEKYEPDLMSVKR